jgi:superfamily II DNA helicase RecQ
MAFSFFVIPVHDNGRAADELNIFLRSHRILHVERQWVDNGSNSYWTFCVDYWDAAESRQSSARGGGNSKARVDFREVLPPEQFAVFSRLRDWRKSVAQQESTPPYTIFDNEQLAQLVTRRVTSKQELLKIPGVGEARAEKYGAAVLELLNSIWTSGQ